jgi:hypothetical protein
MLRFADRLLPGEDPFRDEEKQQQHPDDRRQRHQCFAYQRRHLPDLVRYAPSVAEAGQANDDAEEGGRYGGRLEASCRAHVVGRMRFRPK